MAGRRAEPDPDALERAVAAYGAAPGPETAQRLGEAAEAPRQALFRAINTAPGGTAAVMRMRADCLVAMRNDPALRVVDHDSAHLLGSWFNRGFLELQSIDWQTPAAVLEKLIEYEAVHQIDGWNDLHRRLAADRRCFGFFHPALPGEPLIFIEIALTHGLAGSIQDLLNQAPPADGVDPDVDTAIFYSITNCQAGLTGIPLGSMLIKQVTEELQTELPQLGTFSTLSPTPGYHRWADTTGGRLSPELQRLVLQGDDPIDDGARNAVLGSCAHYLLHAKRRVQPADPVARFHLRNGARVERINWAGDRSTKGRAESYGMLVNYMYDPDQLADNHISYVNDFVVAHSPAVAQLTEK
ncbi:MAG: malonyl-CoA decarboxylase [Acidimicrobiales bacterium]|nr:malonyl-CoA decarboxylase [Acidimicrobiales bacterium]